MKRAFILTCFVLSIHAGFGQSAFYIGLKGGISGCFYMYNASPTSTYFNQNGAAQISSTV